MISKHTKILLLVSIICLGGARGWEHYSQRMYEKSRHEQILYELDLKTGVLRTNESTHIPSLQAALGLVGMFAFLFALPLLVNDITHRRQHH